MGYTHCWTIRRDFKPAEWAQVSEDVSKILADAEHRYEIRICDGMGERGTKPVFAADHIMFNGSGDDAHETFVISRTREGGFCKTARKPYDCAAAAVLCYLDAFHLLGERETKKVIDVSSDGSGRDFLAGLELARQALPKFGNLIDIPRGVMEDDRWCCPWPDMHTKSYAFVFCVDGYAYVIRRKDKAVFRFHSHVVAAKFAQSYREKTRIVRSSWGTRHEGGKELFRPFGSFDDARIRSLARQQAQALSWLFEPYQSSVRDELGTLGHQPPAFVRPDEFPPIKTAYSFDELLQLQPLRQLT
jgi:hypothetical protein